MNWNSNYLTIRNLTEFWTGDENWFEEIKQVCISIIGQIYINFYSEHLAYAILFSLYWARPQNNFLPATLVVLKQSPSNRQQQ